MQNKKNYPDNELGQLIAAGNRCAFKQLYTKHRANVYAFALKFTQCPYISDDLTQDVFIQIWERRSKIGHVKYMNRYLLCICNSLAVNRLRRLAREEKFLEKFRASYDDRTDDEEEIPAWTTREEDSLKIAIEDLSPRRKMIFCRCKIEGMTHADIASEFGIAAGTVNDHIVKGMQRVRKFLKCHPS